MKKSRYTDEQVAYALHLAEGPIAMLRGALISVEQSLVATEMKAARPFSGLISITNRPLMSVSVAEAATVGRFGAARHGLYAA